jgi:hypothetical protein
MYKTEDNTRYVWSSIQINHQLDATISDHKQQHGHHHDTKVKSEATTAVVELFMMGVKTPETCWAVNKRQDNKLEKLLHQVVDLFELYNDARTYKL